VDHDMSPLETFDTLNSDSR